MRNMTRGIAVAVCFLVLMPLVQAAPAGEGGKVKLLLSFEKEEMEKKGFKLDGWKEEGSFVFGPAHRRSFVRASNATDGKCALCVCYVDPQDKRCKEFKDKGYPQYMGAPGNSKSEFYVQYSNKALTFGGENGGSYGGESTKKALGADWTGYDYLWLDVLSPDGDVWLRLIVWDEETTTPYIRFHVPMGKPCTLVFPLARYADPKRVAERPVTRPFEATHIDLKKIDNLIVYLEGSKALAGELFLDNLRLATKDAPAPRNPLAPVQEIERDWGWSELLKTLPPIKQPEVQREGGAVEKLGPITLHSGNTHFGSYIYSFGGHSRAVAAIDNKRILMLLNGLGVADFAFATFDGGKTWGGIDGKAGEPTIIRPWLGVICGAFADSLSGNFYIVPTYVTPKVTSGFANDRVELGPGPDFFGRFVGGGAYCQGGDSMRCIGLQNYVFEGQRWQAGPGALLTDLFTGMCTHEFEMIRVPSGRLWAFFSENLGNAIAHYSDDNGQTWKKSHRGRFLGWFRGYHPAAYGEHVALVGNHYYGPVWTCFDGVKWAPIEYIRKQEGLGVSSLASWGNTKAKDQLFALLGGAKNLYLCRLKDGKWEAPSSALVLDDGSRGVIGSSITTLSRDTVFCFWVRDFERGEDGVWHSKILLRRYHVPTGKLGPEEDPVTEQEPIRALATPIVSAPDYVPLLWDNSWYSSWKRYGYKTHLEVGPDAKNWNVRFKQWVKFLKIPNDQESNKPEAPPAPE